MVVNKEEMKHNVEEKYSRVRNIRIIRIRLVIRLLAVGLIC
jgi:hypothetical protein